MNSLDQSLSSLTERLAAVRGVVAVVLGGSRAEGSAGATSDTDIGLYYREDNSIRIDHLKEIAGELSLDTACVVTELYEWGPWVNGGAWIRTAAGKVDLLYRNLDQVQRTIDDARSGVSSHDYRQQPAYGFYSVTYLAETSICRALYDPEGVVSRLKRAVRDYPLRLKKRIVQNSLWSAEFSLAFADGVARAGDVYSCMGSLARIAADLTQALYVLNEVYYLGDKRAMDRVAGFSHKSHDFVSQLTSALAGPAASSDDLERNVGTMTHLWQGLVDIAGDRYRPRYPV